MCLCFILIDHARPSCTKIMLLTSSKCIQQKSFTLKSHAESSATFIRHKPMLHQLLAHPHMHMQALQELEYPLRLQKLLLNPQREFHVELVITLDSGEVAAFNAYRVQHDNSRGPFKGGFRYHPNADLSDARRSAASFKPSLAAKFCKHVAACLALPDRGDSRMTQTRHL